jgi:hypothetical protein
LDYEYERGVQQGRGDPACGLEAWTRHKGSLSPSAVTWLRMCP